MKGLKQLGAMALAAALTITLAAPISANAEVITNFERDAEGHIIRYTFTNEDTGKTSEYYEDVESETKARTIATNDYGAIEEFKTTCDVAKFTDFKSNKKALKVKVISKDEATDPDKNPCYDTWVGDKVGYRDVNGQWIVTDRDNAPKGQDSGTYRVRLYAKKPGTYKVKYNAVLKNGTTVKKTLKVIAKEDGAAIKSVTFAGKVLDESVDADNPSANRVWAKHWGYNTTTAKKGAIRVTMNKDFKLKKIEVGTPIYKEVAGKEYDYYTKKYVPANYSSSLETIWWDIDGEGDTEALTVSWKKVKNGKKIKMNKDDSYAHEYEKNHTYVDKETSTLTYVRVTYYDKKDKTTHRQLFVIRKVNK